MDYNPCQPDADRTLGDFNLVGRLLVSHCVPMAPRVATGIVFSF